MVFLFVAVTGTNCLAQSNDFYSENTNRIDAYLNGPVKANICEGIITFPTKYKTSKVRSDLIIMSFVNSLINHNTTKVDVNKSISKIRKQKISVEKSVNGLIEANDIVILGEYLRANIKLDFIEKVLVRSKVILRTVSHGKCGPYVDLIDFNIVKNFFIRDAEMLFYISFDELSSDTIYSSNLALLAGQRNDYKFNIPSSSTEGWINEIFTKQYQTDSTGFYSYSKAPKDFIELIRENKIAVIADLLFSPNYFTSVNAMEALIYLSSINKVQLTTELNGRIAQIKDGPFIIKQQGASDVFYNREGYKALQMIDERVIKKYSSSM